VNKIQSYVWLFFKQICFKIPLNLLIFLASCQVLSIGFIGAEKSLSEPSKPIDRGKNNKNEPPNLEPQFLPTFKSEFVIPQINFSTTGRPSKRNSDNLSPLLKEERLDFSATGRPGQRTAGGSRGSCMNDRFNLVALLPESHWGKTFDERPTFWFYISSLPKYKTLGELVLQDENRNDVDRRTVRLDRSAKLVGLKIPKTSAPLVVDRWYRWYLKIHCDSPQASTPIFVQGWVQRVALNPSTELQLSKTNRQDVVYARQGIWYDAVNYLTHLVLDSPESSPIKQDWYKLLTAKGVDLRLPK
jgi:Domain of Unknown Function (DUF928)